MRAYQTYTSGNLFAVRYLGEDGPLARRPSAGLARAPMLFVIDYDDELGQPKFEPITWFAARALHKEAVDDLGARMSADRESYKRWLEEQGGPGKVGWPK